MKHALITAAVLLAAGIVAIFMAGIMLGPAEEPRETNQIVTHIEGEFTDIVIEVAGSEVEVTYTSGDTCHLNYGKDQPIDYTMTVENGTLYVTEHDDRAWYEYLYLEDCWMTLYLPEGDYRSVTIRSTSGDVFVDELQLAQLEVKTSSGHMKVADTVVTDKMALSTSNGDIGIYRCAFDMFEKKSKSGDMEVLDSTGKLFTAQSDSGDTMLKNVLIEETLEMDTSSGDISFQRCDFGALELETASGDVEGTILSKKFFVVTTDSGDCSVPASDENSGRCKITTESGDIEIKIVS